MEASEIDTHAAPGIGLVGDDAAEYASHDRPRADHEPGGDARCQSRPPDPELAVGPIVEHGASCDGTHDDNGGE